ncbi:MAG: hypothetical protein J6Y37_18800 [Paludibacteraceae bacterium]|nr:hypothetical protein [Paludibacteraceae bacterium]
MSDIQDRLRSLSEFNVTFNVADGKFVIRVKYKAGWTVVSPTDETVGFYSDDKDSMTFYYVLPVSRDMSDILDAIDETVSYNRDLEEKVELLKTKVVELRQIFEVEDIETLKTLTFKFKRKKGSKTGGIRIDEKGDNVGKNTEIDNKIEEAIREA